MSASSSIAARALLAVALMVGFYFLALGVAATLLYIPYAEVVFLHRMHVKLVLVCLVGAGAILWSVLPRPDRFSPPGPRLLPERHPRLFEEIQSIASLVGQAMPAEVYLVPDVNAWVSQRGGIMGFGSRRIMGLGLPLMRVLTRSQLRAVLAHEFGHYHGGDTKLGPWVYKTRGAIGRTVTALSGQDGAGTLLQKPFEWYGTMFLRITHAVSRRQELGADELAARKAGSRALIDGLRIVHSMGSVFPAYWANECVPVLQMGYRPMLAQGFRQFVQAGEVTRAIQASLDEAMKRQSGDPFDTHPPLKERVAAVLHLPAGEVLGVDPESSSLLDDLNQLEGQLLAAIAGEEEFRKLRPIDWKDVGTQVYLPRWKALAKANAVGLRGITPESIPAQLADAGIFAERFVTLAGEKPGESDAKRLAAAVLGSALTVSLVARGGRLDASPGTPVVVDLGTARVETFNVFGALADRTLTPEAWRAQCEALGIPGLDLGRCVEQLPEA